MRKILQKLLSKLFIVSTIIIIQMIWWFFLFYTASVASRVFQDLLYVAAILLSLYIVNRRMKMYIKMSWIFLILSVPIVGIPCYFFFGRPELTSKTQKRMARIVEAYAPLRPENELLNETLRLTDMDAYRQSRLITQNQKYPLYAEDCTEYFKSGEEAFESILKDLRSAEKFIFMEYFIIGSGVMLDQILDILKEKVKHGVVVRIIYDDFGSINAIPPHFIKEMESIGIQTRRFNPYKPMLSVIMNDRDHRKILVIDGRVAHTGGYNIADEYINKKKKYGHWKDIGFKLTGTPVKSYNYMFIEFWNAFSNEKIDSNIINECLSERKNENGYIISYYDSPAYKEHISNNLYIDLLSQAINYAWFYTPYLIIGDFLMDALIKAAERGVDVRIFIPGIPDKKIVYRLSKSYYAPLLKAGIKIFEYIPGFIHAKACLIDDNIGTIGTVNLDYRSLFLHFECNSLFYKSSILDELKIDMIETQKKCKEVKEKDIKKGYFHRVFDAILRIFAPLC